MMADLVHLLEFKILSIGVLAIYFPVNFVRHKKKYKNLKTQAPVDANFKINL